MGDTSIEALRAYYAQLRLMTSSARLAQARRLSQRKRSVAEAGVRRRHPDYDDEQVRLAVSRLVLGKELFEAVYSGCTIEP